MSLIHEKPYSDRVRLIGDGWSGAFEYLGPDGRWVEAGGFWGDDTAVMRAYERSLSINPPDTGSMTIEDARRVARLTRMLLMLAYSGPVPGIVLKGTAALLAEHWPAFDWEVRGQELTPFARGVYSAPMSAESSAPLADAVAGLDGKIRELEGKAVVYFEHMQPGAPAIVFPVGPDAWRSDADGWWRRPLHVEGNAIRIWQPVAPMNVPDEVITEYLRLIGSISDDVSADVSSNAE